MFFFVIVCLIAAFFGGVVVGYYLRGNDNVKSYEEKLALKDAEIIRLDNALDFERQLNGR